MKTRLLIIIGILLSLIVILIITFSIFGSSLFPSEHCPDLAMKKALGLVDPTAACF